MTRRAGLAAPTTAIGAATAALLARLRADGAVTYLAFTSTDHRHGPPLSTAHRAQGPEETAAAVEAAGRRAFAVESDLTHAETPARLFAEAEAALGLVSILINNASGSRKDTFSPSREDARGRCNELISGGIALPQLLVDARSGALMIAELAASVRRHRLGWGRIVSLTSGGPAGCATLFAMKDWLAWHEAYDDRSSSLARRLEVVRLRLGAVLDANAGKPQRLLSLCAGDGRDVIPVLAARRASSSVSALLIEMDEELARRATEAAASAGLACVEVRCADAGDVSSFKDVLPVDVLLLCGIFGNVAYGRVKGIIEAVPQLLFTDGCVIWTRGGSEPDRRPELRSWFREVGLAEVSFDGAPETFGVGVNRLLPGRSDSPRQLPSRLFSFVTG